jgi:hypothetical protein
MTMQYDIDRLVDLVSVEREARRLRAEAFSQAVRRLADRLMRREPPKNASTAHAA